MAYSLKKLLAPVERLELLHVPGTYVQQVQWSRLLVAENDKMQKKKTKQKKTKLASKMPKKKIHFSNIFKAPTDMMAGKAEETSG